MILSDANIQRKHTLVVKNKTPHRNKFSVKSYYTFIDISHLHPPYWMGIDDYSLFQSNDRLPAANQLLLKRLFRIN